MWLAIFFKSINSTNKYLNKQAQLIVITQEKECQV